MDKFINNHEFMTELFDDAEQAERAGEIGAAILEARAAHDRHCCGNGRQKCSRV